MNDNLRIYAQHILNAPMNLTSAKDIKTILSRHINDSLSLLPILPEGTFSLLDVGTGGGFPGMVLKIVRPEIKLTLLDSTRKKLIYLESIAAKLGIAVKTVHARAEHHTGQYDIVAARAVADLPTLCAWCLPFVKPGGRFFAMKGSRWAEELAAARDIPAQYGAKWREPYEYTLPLPDGDAKFAVCIAEKTMISGL
jgi:16S rRNA (guanine527-N7)-methyltransferase